MRAKGEGRGGGIYDVSKTSIRRSLTPIVAFHAVRVCRYQNYIVVKLTSCSPSPRLPSTSSFSSSVLLWGEGRGEREDNIARTREHPARGCPSQDSREPIVPLAPSFLLACVMRAIHCTRVVNACIFLN